LYAADTASRSWCASCSSIWEWSNPCSCSTVAAHTRRPQGRAIARDSKLARYQTSVHDHAPTKPWKLRHGVIAVIAQRQCRVKYTRVKALPRRAASRGRTSRLGRSPRRARCLCHRTSYPRRALGVASWRRVAAFTDSRTARKRASRRNGFAAARRTVAAQTVGSHTHRLRRSDRAGLPIGAQLRRCRHAWPRIEGTGTRPTAPRGLMGVAATSPWRCSDRRCRRARSRWCGSGRSPRAAACRARRRPRTVRRTGTRCFIVAIYLM